MKAAVFGPGAIGAGVAMLMVEEIGIEVVVIARNTERFQQLKGVDIVQVNRVGVGVSDTQEIRLSSVINGEDNIAMAEYFSDPDLKLVFTAVKVPNLDQVARILASALMKRQQADVTSPLCILPFENILESGSVFRELLESHAQCPMPNTFTSSVVVDCMSFRPHDGRIIREFYEETMVGLTGNPEIDNLLLQLPRVRTTSEGIADWYDKKSILVSGVHTAIAWLGQFSNIEYTNQAALDPRLLPLIRALIDEMAEAVYSLTEQRFDLEELNAYGHQTVTRVSNPYLLDPCSKFTRSLPQKLSPYERFTKPALHFLSAVGLIPWSICKIIGLGLWLGLNVVEGVGDQCLDVINQLPPELKTPVLKFAENPVLW